MSEEVVSKRYAEALFELATEKNLVEEIGKELAVVGKVFADETEFVEILNHPKVTQEEKISLLEKTLGQTEKTLQNLLKLLVERHRIGLVTKIAQAFTEKYNEVNGIAVAEVSSVRALSDDEKTAIEAALKELLKKSSVTIENIVNPSLLGGLRIRVGNTIFDGSVSGKLNRLKNNIGVKAI